MLILVTIVLLLTLGRSAAERLRDNAGWNRFTKLEVEGLERVAFEQVQAKAALQAGMVLDDLRLDSIAARVQTIPAVKSAKAGLRYPGKLVIHITERKPVALVASGNPMLIDECGVMFPRASLREYLDYPVITGEPAAMQPAQIKSAAAELAEIADEWPVVYRNLSEVHLTESGREYRLRQTGAALKLRDGLDAFKLNVLSQFLLEKGELLKEDVCYLDMRFQNMVIIGARGE